MIFNMRPAYKSKKPLKISNDQLEVGDRVELIKVVDRIHLQIGDKGTVVQIANQDKPAIGVEWDKYIDGHDCDNYSKNGSGWYVNKFNIKVINV